MVGCNEHSTFKSCGDMFGLTVRFIVVPPPSPPLNQHHDFPLWPASSSSCTAICASSSPFAYLSPFMCCSSSFLPITPSNWLHSASTDANSFPIWSVASAYPRGHISMTVWNRITSMMPSRLLLSVLICARTCSRDCFQSDGQSSRDSTAARRLGCYILHQSGLQDRPGGAQTRWVQVVEVSRFARSARVLLPFHASKWFMIWKVSKQLHVISRLRESPIVLRLQKTFYKNLLPLNTRVPRFHPRDDKISPSLHTNAKIKKYERSGILRKLVFKSLKG